MPDSDSIPHLRLRNITRTHEVGEVRVEALQGINLDIDPGEMIAIVGPSGSGKTSLMNIMGCLDRPTMGFYQLRGLNVGGLTDNNLAELRKSEIGFVFQTFNLLGGLTALENVTLPLTYTPARRPEARAMEALERVGLAHRAGHRPSALSGGEQQRVAIARALVNAPGMILADEPTGNLDSQMGRDVIGLFRNLNEREGVTVVIVTHDHEVSDLVDRVVSVRDGKVVGDERANGASHEDEAPT